MYDIIVVGGGPAGLTAALYALRANKSVMVIEKGAFGGQITYSPKVENYPGHPTLTGNELAEKMVGQVLEQGADVEPDKVTDIELAQDGIKTVITENGRYQCKAVIIAVGVRHRMLGLDGEEELVGDGISFCAVCDGAFYRNKDVTVIGGGNSALQEAILLSENCKSVTVIQNLDHFTGEERLVNTLLKKQNVSVIYGARVTALNKNSNGLCGITIETATGEKQIATEGMFVAIGLIPSNMSFAKLADLDDYGYFASDEECKTKTDGVFVAGDCRAKKIRQVTTAAADGAVAAIAACDYIDSVFEPTENI